MWDKTMGRWLMGERRGVSFEQLKTLGRLAAPLLKRPAAAAAVAIALGIATGVVLNAVVLQKTRHPAPLLATRAPAAALPVKAEPARGKPTTQKIVAARSEKGEEITKSIPPSAQPAPALTGPELVKAIQAELHARRLYAGKVDGAFGPRTARAIRAFERDERLPETGKPSETLLRLLRAPKAPAAPAPQVVTSVQRVLASLGYGPLRVNGALGPETRQAIERFELDRGLPATGFIHERLLHELERVTGAPIG